MEGHEEPYVVHARGEHTHTLILLHGRGSNAADFGPPFLVSKHSSDRMLVELFPGLKYIFPNARRRRVTSFKRATMRQWYGLDRLGESASSEQIKTEGLQESSQYIHGLILEEMKLIPCRNIIIGGLSQGCATALFTMLTFEPPHVEGQAVDNRLGACVGMSGGLPLHFRIDEFLSIPTMVPADGSADRSDKSSVELPRSVQTLNMLREIMEMPELETLEPAAFRCPVFLGHGTADDTVPLRQGKAAMTVLRSMGIEVHWVEYEDFYHWYKEPDEIDDIVDFLQRKTGLLDSL